MWSLVRDCGFGLESAVVRSAYKPDAMCREIGPGLASRMCNFDIVLRRAGGFLSIYPPKKALHRYRRTKSRNYQILEPLQIRSSSVTGTPLDNLYGMKDFASGSV